MVIDLAWLFQKPNVAETGWLFIEPISFSLWARLHFMSCLVVWWLWRVLASGM